jgi:hypothetical protein
MEMQIKITLRFPLSPVRMVISKNKTNKQKKPTTSVIKDAGERNPYTLQVENVNVSIHC